MPSIRIRPESHEILAKLAEQTGASQTDLVERAVALLEEAIFYQQMRETYAETEAVQSAQAEIEEWDGTLEDGLEGLE